MIFDMYNITHNRRSLFCFTHRFLNPKKEKTKIGHKKEYEYEKDYEQENFQVNDTEYELIKMEK